jgi:hypothetical protein
MTEEILSQALIVSYEALGPARHTCYHALCLWPGIELVQPVQNIAHFIDATGPTSVDDIAVQLILCVRGQLWLQELGRDFDEFEPILPAGSSRGIFAFDVPAVDFADHASHGFWLVAFQFDVLSLLVLVRAISQVTAFGVSVSCRLTAAGHFRPNMPLKYSFREQRTDLWTGILRPSLSSMVRSDHSRFSNQLRSILAHRHSLLFGLYGDGKFSAHLFNVSDGEYEDSGLGGGGGGGEDSAFTRVLLLRFAELMAC